MSVKTDIQLKNDNTTLLSTIDNRYNHLTTLKTLIDDVVDSKETLLGNPSTNGYILSSTTAGVRTWIATPSTVTPAALSKVDDTNITLSLGGTPTTALLQAVSLTLGWTGTLADARIASAVTWNAKQNALNGTGLVRMTGTTVSYDNATYLTANQTITLGTDLSGSGTTTLNATIVANAITTTKIANAAVTIVKISATGTADATTYLRGDGSWQTISSGGITSLSAIGATPNANAGTITGAVLNLQPASELFGGVITTTTQKFAGDKTLGANGANATSTATQKSSFKRSFESSLWNGSVESKNTFELYNKASITVNSESFNTTAYNGTDIFRMSTTGNTWYLPNFTTNNVFSIVCEATDKKLMSIDSVGGRIVIGYDSISPTLDTGNIDYIVIGNKTYSNLDNSSATESFDKVVLIGNNIQTSGFVRPQYMPSNSVIIGHDLNISTNGASNSIIIGNANMISGSTTADYITLANAGTSGYANTFQAGSRTTRMTNVYFGGGRYDTNTYSISGCNAVETASFGFSLQTDTAGGAIILKGGWSTGTAIPGPLDLDSYLQTNSTGSTANNTQANILRIHNNNIALFGKNANYEYGAGVEVLYWNKATINPTTNPTNGAIFYVDNADKLPKYRDISGFTITL